MNNNEIDAVLERVAERIAANIESPWGDPHCPDCGGTGRVYNPFVGTQGCGRCSYKEPSTKAKVAAELAKIRSLLVAAPKVDDPAGFHTHGDFALESATLNCPACRAQSDLRQALVGFLKEPSNG
jgi:hypothetical protein